VHNAAAFVDTHGNRAVARRCRESVATAAAERDNEREVGHDVGSEVATDAVEVPQRRGWAGCFRVGVFHVFLPSLGRVTGAGYWQPQVPAPVTSERRVAVDGAAELEPELELGLGLEGLV
jgi:hypothetical protein